MPYPVLVRSDDEEEEVEEEEGRKDNAPNGLVEQASGMLYGLIHARFLMTSQGLTVMVYR